MKILTARSEQEEMFYHRAHEVLDVWFNKHIVSSGYGDRLPQYLEYRKFDIAELLLLCVERKRREMGTAHDAYLRNFFLAAKAGVIDPMTIQGAKDFFFNYEDIVIRVMRGQETGGDVDRWWRMYVRDFAIMTTDEQARYEKFFHTTLSPTRELNEQEEKSWLSTELFGYDLTPFASFPTPQ